MKTLWSFPVGADASKAGIAPTSSITIPASHNGHFSSFFSSIPQIFLLGKEEEEEEEEGQTLAWPWICPGNGAALVIPGIGGES